MSKYRKKRHDVREDDSLSADQQEAELAYLTSDEETEMEVNEAHLYFALKDEIDKQEHFLDLVRIASYILYSGGLIIGVLGQLVGVETKGPKWPG
jgi:hypothetical protein